MIRETFCRLAESVVGHLGHNKIALAVVSAALIGTRATGNPRWLVVSMLDAAKYMLRRQAQGPSADGWEPPLSCVEAVLSDLVESDAILESLHCVSGSPSVAPVIKYSLG